MGTDSTRVSGTEWKAQAGFSAQMQGIDLSTLIQMACMQRARLVVCVRSRGREGYLFFEEGRLAHAISDDLRGEPALFGMLGWSGGEAVVCDAPWPREPRLESSTEALLIRAAQLKDEAAPRAPDKREQSSMRKTPAALALAARGGRTLSPRPLPQQSVLATVRLDINGEVVTAHGPADQLALLVAYVTRLGALLADQLGLEPFGALYADLGERRIVVFAEGPEMVGLAMRPGPLVQELRHQLGI